MTEAEFWRIIETTKYASRGDGEKQAALLVEYLSQLSEGEILDFDAIFYQYHAEAYRCNLWEAKAIIEDFDTEDGFKDFRAGLIGRGQAIYEQALADPENLVDVIEAGEYISAEAILYVADEAYQLKLGDEEAFIPPSKQTIPQLKGEWSDVKTWLQKFPKLTAKFGSYWDNYYRRK